MMKFKKQFFARITAALVFMNSVFTAIPVNAAKPQGSIIKNGGFEAAANRGTKELTNWKFEGNNTVQIDKVIKKEGGNSLKITSNNYGASGVVSQLINMPGSYINKTIKISQWIKTSAFTSKAINILIKYYDKNGTVIDTKANRTQYVGSDIEWTLFENNFDIPDNYKIASFSVNYEIKSSGTLWLDEVKVEPYTRIKNINATPSLLDLTVGKGTVMNIKAEPSDATYKDFSLSSADTSIAAINKDNLVKGVKKGVTKIKVQQSYQGLISYIPVIVGKANTITVNQINKVSTTQGKVFSGKVSAKTSAGNTLKYSLFIDGNNGYVNVNSDGSFYYYPDKDFYGKDSFTIIINGSNGDFNLAQYNLEVQKASVLPEIDAFMVVMKQGEGSAIGNINQYGINLSGIQLSISKNTSKGSFTLQGDGSYKYVPDSNFAGYDSVEIKESDSSGNYKVIKGTIYVAPGTQSLGQALNTDHPRIMATASDFARIKTLVSKDSTVIPWFNRLKQDTDEILSKPVVPYQKPDGLRLVTTSKNYIEQLSFMYRITGEAKYASRAWRELQNICSNYPDWNDKGEFLNTSTMAVGAAIGYDWLYDYLNTSQRKLIEAAITDKALKQALSNYTSNIRSFVQDKYNWNVVCNSGIIVASLAIGNIGTVPMQTLQEGLKSIQNSLIQYYSDGSGVEGPRYWSFATEYLIYANSSLKTALKNGAVLTDMLNLQQLAMFENYITGTQGVFNFSDTSNDIMPGYYSLWAAKELNKGVLTQYFKAYKLKVSARSVYDFIWYEPSLYNSVTSELPLDNYYKTTQVTTMRSDFDSNYARFLAFKGGVSGAAHGDLDVGSFVYDALGVRWAIDLGAENYNVSGYWDTQINGIRWKYYRKRAEGHNTLTIGTDYKEDQVAGSYSEVIDSSLNTAEPYSVLDMTPAYADKAVKVQREYRLLNNRKDLSITDNFVLKQEAEVVWQMHTKADAVITDGGKTVILEQDYKRLAMKLDAASNMVFQIVDAAPSAASPNPAGQSVNSGVKKIIVKTKVKTGTIKVLILPLEEGMPLISNGGFEEDLKYWNTWKSGGDLGVEVDKTVKSSGTGAAKLYNKTSGAARGSISEAIEVTELSGKILKVAQRFKSQNLRGSVKLRVKYMDANWTQIGDLEVKTVDMNGTKDWSTVLYFIIVPNNPNIKKISIEYLYDSCTGILWIDDVTVTK